MLHGDSSIQPTLGLPSTIQKAKELKLGMYLPKTNVNGIENAQILCLGIERECRM